MESEKASETYSRAEIRRILGINENRLRSWERVGLASAQHAYTFKDLISLRTLQSLSESKIPAKHIYEAMQQLRRLLGDIGRPLDELKIVSDGRRIAVELPGERMEALTGQLLFDFEQDNSLNVATMGLPGRPVVPTEGQEGEEYWFRHALDLERKGAELGEIIAAYRKVLDCNPQAAGAWVNIGTLHYRQGRLELAEQSYGEALRTYPEYALAHYNMANVCEETNRLREAARHYEAALSHRADYADAHYNLALVYERRERLLDAAKHWDRYLELDPTSAWAEVARRKRDRLLRLLANGERNESSVEEIVVATT